MQMELELHLNPKNDIDGVKEVKFDLGSKRQAKVITGVRRKKSESQKQEDERESESANPKIQKTMWLKHDDSIQALIEEDDKE